MKAVGHDVESSLPLRRACKTVDAVSLAGLNRMLDDFSDRSATALCTFTSCVGLEDEVLLFEGKTRGSIVLARLP